MKHLPDKSKENIPDTPLLRNDSEMQEDMCSTSSAKCLEKRRIFRLPFKKIEQTENDTQ